MKAEAFEDLLLGQLVEDEVKELVAAGADKEADGMPARLRRGERVAKDLAEAALKPPAPLVVDQVLAEAEKLSELVQPGQRKAAGPGSKD